MSIAKTFGIGIKTMVIDRRFYSYSNLQELQKAGLKFIIPSIQKREMLAERLNRMGKMILISNSPRLNHEQVLVLHRQKDNLEKMFDIMKNEIHEYRLRVAFRPAMEGKSFITFLAIILYSSILQKMKKIKKYTVSELMMELKKIRVVSSDVKKPFITEISKKQHIIFQQLNIPIPLIPCY